MRFSVQQLGLRCHGAAALPENVLCVKNISISYTVDHAPHDVVMGLSFNVAQGEMLAIIGRSGCGKTTLLKAIAGLLPTTSGEIEFRGRPIRSPERDRAMVFQEYGTFPWLTVKE